MFSNKTRNTIMALVASLGVAGVAALAPTASEALPVQGNGGFPCYHEGREYPDGTEITLPSGRTARCVNGIWEIVGWRELAPPPPWVPPVYGVTASPSRARAL
jgi:hypothetical protein